MPSLHKDSLKKEVLECLSPREATPRLGSKLLLELVLVCNAMPMNNTIEGIAPGNTADILQSK